MIGQPLFTNIMNEHCCFSGQAKLMNSEWLLIYKYGSLHVNMLINMQDVTIMLNSELPIFVAVYKKKKIMH